jgi:crotonobetainyl-CoA:carnitine CoA-transferase CaiB-like acyl-CoA transferase
MRAGEIHNRAALEQFGRPLDGLRVLALEQMQTLPVATQLMVRLGAEVVKVESPAGGESGRQALPKIKDRAGRDAGATFLRYGLGKKSIAVDLKSARGVALIKQLVPQFDVVCENLGPGRAKRLGVDYDALSAVNPRLVYLSVSGFGNLDESPYADWPAYAGVAEAMCGAYEYSRRPHQAPIVNPLGGVGDTAAGMCGLVGVLAALRHRDRIGRGQYVDISMVDAMVHMCDYVPIFWSLGLRRVPDQPERRPTVMEGFQAKDGWFMMQVSRRHHFERLANIVGKPEWLSDDRFSTPWGWQDHLDEVLRPGIEAWAADKSKFLAAKLLAEAGVVAAPCHSGDDVVSDPHIAMRRMLVEVPRTDGVEQPVIVAGNPVKMSLLAEGVETEFPYAGEHTDEVLAGSLGLEAAAIAELRAAGVVA